MIKYYYINFAERRRENVIFLSGKSKRFFVSMILAVALLTGCSTNVQTVSSGSNSQKMQSEHTDTSSVNISGETINDAAVSINETSDSTNYVTITFKDHNPIKLSLSIPNTWRLEPVNDKQIYIGYCSPVDIYLDDEKIGYIANNIFSEFPEQWKADNPGWENNYYSIYNQLMGSNHITWNQDYKVIEKNEFGETATCKIFNDIVAMPDKQNTLDDGVLSYNKSVNKYILIYLENGILAPEELTTLAKSIEISK